MSIIAHILMLSESSQSLLNSAVCCILLVTVLALGFVSNKVVLLERWPECFKERSLEKVQRKNVEEEIRKWVCFSFWKERKWKQKFLLMSSFVSCSFPSCMRHIFRRFFFVNTFWGPASYTKIRLKNIRIIYDLPLSKPLLRLSNINLNLKE